MTIVLPVRTRRVRRQRDAAGSDGAPPPATDGVPRVAHMLALAHHWRGLIRDGVVKDQAALSRLVGVTRARVTQVMGLLCLAPDIQAAVLLGSSVSSGWEPPSHRAVLAVSSVPLWIEQRAMWKKLWNGDPRGGRSDSPAEDGDS